MQEIVFGDLYGQHREALSTHSALMLSAEATILRRSNEPNEIFRLDVLDIRICKPWRFSPCYVFVIVFIQSKKLALIPPILIVRNSIVCLSCL